MLRRTSSSWARIGTASRQTPTIPTTLPSMLSGKYSRTTVDVARPGPAAPLAVTSTMSTTADVPVPARANASEGAADAPLRAGSSAKMTVPSGRLTSTRRIVPGVTSVLSWRSTIAWRSPGSVPAAKSSGETKLPTKARTSAVSVPTIELRVFVEKCAETMAACAVAVTPTIIRKMPNTSISTTGRRTCADMPKGREATPGLTDDMRETVVRAAWDVPMTEVPPAAPTAARAVLYARLGSTSSYPSQRMTGRAG